MKKEKKDYTEAETIAFKAKRVKTQLWARSITLQYPDHFTSQQRGITHPGGVKEYFPGLGGNPLMIAKNANRNSN